MVRRTQLLIALAAFAVVALWASAQPTPEELAANRRRLEALRKNNPEQLARLRENLKSFQQLPENRQQEIRKLDTDLHDFSPKKQDRYRAMLERYADWLDGLRVSDAPAYQAIQNAPDAKTRLALIKERRDLEWMKSQPKAIQKEWEKLERAARTEFVVQLRLQEREKHENWLLAKRFWAELNDPKQTMPSRLSDFGTVSKDKKTEVNKVKDYVENYLLPQLKPEEKAQLDKAEGHWPDYPRTLVALASKRPSALPPERNEDLPIHFAQLPPPIQLRVTDKKAAKKKPLQELKNFDGRPEFASKVVEIGTKKGSAPFEHEFWACNFNALQPAMKEFVEKDLKPRLKENSERVKLLDNEGKWPYYPLTIQELSKKYNLQPPWHYLPGRDRWKWDLYRNPKYKSLTAETK